MIPNNITSEQSKDIRNFRLFIFCEAYMELEDLADTVYRIVGQWYGDIYLAFKKY